MLRFPCKQANTRIRSSGVLFFIFTVLVGAIAVNSGNNLVYLAFSVVLSFLILSGLLSYYNQKNLQVIVNLPDMIFAKKNTIITLQIINKSLIPKFFLTLEILGKKAHFEEINRKSIKTLKIKFEERGKFTIDSAQITSTFPFNFFIRSKRIKLKKEITVYPPVKEIILQKRTVNNKTNNESSRLQKNALDEFYSIRQYKNGDNSKLINWKASAKLGKIMITEYTSAESNRILIVLNNSKYIYNNEKEFEEAITKVNSLIYNCYKSGTEVSLISSEIVFPFAKSTAHFKNIFNFLSTVKLKSNLPIKKINSAILPEDIKYA